MEHSAWNIEGVLSPNQPTEMGEFARLFGFLRPEAAMRDIVARPIFVVPLALSVVAAIAYAVTARPVLAAPNALVATSVSMFVGLLVRLIFLTAVLTAAAAALSQASIPFGRMLAVVCYSRVPGILFAALAIFLILLRRASGLPDNSPINPMMTNLAVFLDPATTSRFVYSLASSVDCVLFWELSLMSIGLKAASGIDSKIANLSVVILWVVYALGQAAWIQYLVH